jgi:hypothetical protein
MMVSRAAKEVISPMPIFQLNPSGLMTGSMVRPSARPGCPDGRRMAVGVGQCAATHRQHRHQQDHRAGAPQKNLRAIQQPQPERLNVGQR